MMYREKYSGNLSSGATGAKVLSSLSRFYFLLLKIPVKRGILIGKIADEAWILCVAEAERDVLEKSFHRRFAAANYTNDVIAEK